MLKIKFIKEFSILMKKQKRLKHINILRNSRMNVFHYFTVVKVNVLYFCCCGICIVLCIFFIVPRNIILSVVFRRLSFWDLNKKKQQLNKSQYKIFITRKQQKCCERRKIYILFKQPDSTLIWYNGYIFRDHEYPYI